MPERKYWEEELETLPRQKLEQLQLTRLQEHLEFAYRRAPYYKQSFDAAGVKPSDLKRLEDLRRFPFIDKKVERDRQLAAPDLGDMVAVPEEEIVFVSASSGSTGVPTLSPFTKKDFDDFQNVESRQYWSIGMRPKDRYLHALNFSLFVGGPDVIGAQNLGALCIWAGTLPSDRLLYIIKQFKPTITWTTPSYAWYLGETALKQGIDPARDLSISQDHRGRGTRRFHSSHTRRHRANLECRFVRLLRALRYFRLLRWHVPGEKRTPSCGRPDTTGSA